jgi:hypothetical protein
MNTRPGPFVIWMSLPLAALFSATSAAGVFWPPTYAQEKIKWAVQGIAGDAVSLFVIVPVLLVSAILAYRGSIAARLVWLGTLLCILYSSIFYTLAVHFNQLFFIYCGVLGFSFYGIVGSLSSLPAKEIAARYGPRAPVKAAAIVLMVFALLTAVQWLQQIVPALVSGKPPQEVVETGLFTHPAAVLDLSTFLPAMFICAVMLLRRKSIAFILAPALMSAMLLMTLSIEGMAIGMYVRGMSPRNFLVSFSVGAAVLFSVLSFLLVRFFRSGAHTAEIQPVRKQAAISGHRA